jgi:hypothetical protein
MFPDGLCRDPPDPTVVLTHRLSGQRCGLDPEITYGNKGAVNPSADLVDLVCAPDSSTPVYARVKAVQAYAALLDQLGQVAPVQPGTFAQFLEELSTPTKGETSERFG